jgi:dienelactone hydrolase
VAAVLGVVAVGSVTAAEPPGKFALPKDRAAWVERRDSVRKTLLDLLGDWPPRPAVPKVEELGREPREGYTLHRFRFDNAAGAQVPGVLLVPDGADADHRVPAILYLHYCGPLGKQEVLRPGPDGGEPGVSLIRRGYAVMCIDAYFSGERRGPGPDGGELSLFKTFLVEGKSLWGMMLRDDAMSLDYLLSRPEVDPKRVGVTGMSMGATRAWWLMALDERVACGVAVACLPRFNDLIASGQQRAHAPYLWVPGLLRHFDTEAVLALCAPRPLDVMVGDRDPTSPIAGVRFLKEATRRAYRLYDKESEFQSTIFGGLGHAYTPLEWDMMLEFFDKHFLPQGPTPLPRSPEPEPAPDSRWIDPAAHSIAGWVAEMSHRPTTWTWRDGIIACKPGRSEYGWLRAPVELGDFALTVEWKVPPGANSGIFVRARPVPWSIPPSAAGKERVSTLGLDWPSRTGLEIQSADDPGGPNKYSTGALYRHAAPASKPNKPGNQWNRTTIRCRGLRVEVWINGEQVQDTRLDRLPTLKTPPLRGYFGLQCHGDPAEFRNLRYLRLDGESD